jgi:hypothetical protein
MRRIIYVDLAMCGGEELPPDFDLEDFCEVLQRKLPRDVEVVPFTESLTGARQLNPDPHLVSDAVFNEALGEYWHH